MLHRYLLSLFTAITLFSFQANAQAPKLKWENSYGGSNIDIAYAVQQTSDGGYITVGYTQSNDGDVTGFHGTTGNPDAWIVKTDDTGKIMWAKALGGSGLDYSYAVQQTADGGYIVAGVAGSTDGDLTGVPNSNYGMWIIKLDSLGNIVWQQCHGGTNGAGAFAIEQTIDGGYIVAGSTQSDDGDVTGIHKDSTGAPTLDEWVVKLNDTGGITWQKTLGGSGSETAQSVWQTADGGYIVGGYTNSSDGDVTKHYGDATTNDVWLVKLSSTGTLVWQATYGGTKEDELTSVIQTPDGGYVFTGQTNSNDNDVSGNHLDSTSQTTIDIWVAKTDSAGNLSWQKCYGGVGTDAGSQIQLTVDTGYIVAGVTYSKNGDGDVTGGSHAAGYGTDDFWVLQLTPTGSINWNKCLGGIGYEEAYSIKVTSDGGYIVAGDASYNNGDVTGIHGHDDFWLVKLAGPILAVNNVIASANSLQIFPNPTLAAFTIQYHFGINKNASAEITDITGRVINVVPLDKNTTQAEINAASWAPGTYFYKVIQNNITVVAGKLVKD